MITINNKKDCCGCSACVEACPVKCIDISRDNEGFEYPIINPDNCIECNVCNRVCPVINLKTKDNTHEIKFPKQSRAYAAYIKNNEILEQSSSGGVFTAISQNILTAGGIVYGATWVDGNVEHLGIEKEELLCKLRGSKYVQSSIKGSFLEIKKYLKEGRKVLFSGTPCQVAGLKYFLGKNYDHLLCVEIACHGVPSPKVLRLYMDSLKDLYGEAVNIDFRAKLGGWENYKITAFNGNRHYFYESPKENLFMKGFLHELYSRPICHECPFKSGRSGADITLADFWGIKNILPDFNYFKGVSLVLTHNSKYDSLFTNLHNIVLKEVDLGKALAFNGSLVRSEAPHPERKHFFKFLDKKNINHNINSSLKLRWVTKLKILFKALTKKLV